MLPIRKLRPVELLTILAILPDPEGVLQGSGTMVRFIRLSDASELDRPAVKALMAEALKRADPPLDPKGKRRILIKQTRRTPVKGKR